MLVTLDAISSLLINIALNSSFVHSMKKVKRNIISEVELETLDTIISEVKMKLE